MTMPGDAEQKMETYLARLRRLLRGMNDGDAGEIVAELRSHITEKASSRGEVTSDGVDAVLAALGSPEELASQYITDGLLARAEVSRSPVRILRSLFQWASLSVAGVFVLMGSLIGYFLAGAFVLCALLKSFHPRTAGLWLLDSGDFTLSLRLGFEAAPPGSREVLGWWIVPLGLMAGCGLVVLTTRCALWFARRYRRSLALPGV